MIWVKKEDIRINYILVFNLRIMATYMIRI